MADPKPKRRRLRAGEERGIGAERYNLIRAAADRIRTAMVGGWYLEATSLIESILTDRMEKRAQYLHDHQPAPPAALISIANGFKNLIPLVNGLRNHEPDPELRACILEVESWATGRNRAIHEMAKFGTDLGKPWEERLERAEEVARNGIELLLRYDRAERRVCHNDRGRRFASATCPDALSAIGQQACEHCASLESRK